MRKKELHRECKKCRKGFTTRRGAQIFCSPSCKDSFHNKIKMTAIQTYRRRAWEEKEKE